MIVTSNHCRLLGCVTILWKYIFQAYFRYCYLWQFLQDSFLVRTDDKSMILMIHQWCPRLWKWAILVMACRRGWNVAFLSRYTLYVILISFVILSSVSWYSRQWVLRDFSRTFNFIVFAYVLLISLGYYMYTTDNSMSVAVLPMVLISCQIHIKGER